MHNKKFQELIDNKKDLPNNYENFDEDVLNEFEPHWEMNYQNENIEEQEEIVNNFQAHDTAFNPNNI